MNSNTATPLANLRIASPCSADWNAMTGDDRARYCSECNLHVYKLSDMSEAEATAFVREAEGRTCVRFYRRADGTFLTRDCPSGLRAVRRKIASLAAGAAALFGFISLGVFSAWANKPENSTAGPVEKLQSCTEEQQVMFMGAMCPSPLTPPGGVIPAGESDVPVIELETGSQEAAVEG